MTESLCVSRKMLVSWLRGKKVNLINVFTAPGDHCCVILESKLRESGMG